jgi:Pyruvate/2-oxoacid:ferredoxin oxidoreductase gamma subunit
MLPEPFIAGSLAVCLLIFYGLNLYNFKRFRRLKKGLARALSAVKELVFGVHVVEAMELAKKVGDVILQNVVIVGCLAASEFTAIKTEAFRTAITEPFADKGLDINCARAFKKYPFLFQTYPMLRGNCTFKSFPTE